MFDVEFEILKENTTNEFKKINASKTLNFLDVTKNLSEF